MEEILKTIGINTSTGTKSSDGSYVIDLVDYDEYMKYFSILEKADEQDKIDQLEENSVINTHTTDVHYTIDTDNDKTYEISLLGDLDQEVYKLVITEF